MTNAKVLVNKDSERGGFVEIDLSEVKETKIEPVALSDDAVLDRGVVEIKVNNLQIEE